MHKDLIYIHMDAHSHGCTFTWMHIHMDAQRQSRKLLVHPNKLRHSVWLSCACLCTRGSMAVCASHLGQTAPSFLKTVNRQKRQPARSNMECKGEGYAQSNWQHAKQMSVHNKLATQS